MTLTRRGTFALYRAVMFQISSAHDCILNDVVMLRFQRIQRVGNITFCCGDFDFLFIFVTILFLFSLHLTSF